MRDLLFVTGIFALAHAGMTFLALAMDRHHRQLRPGAVQARQGQRVAWRAAGISMLTSSLWLCMESWGAATGTTAWFGILGAVSLALVLLLAYAPTIALRAGWGAGAAGIGELAVALLSTAGTF